MLYVHRNEKDFLDIQYLKNYSIVELFFYTEIIAAADTICSFKKTIKNERSIYYLGRQKNSQKLTKIYSIV